MSALGTVAGVFRPGPVERLTFDLSYEPDRVRAWALGQLPDETCKVIENLAEQARDELQERIEESEQEAREARSDRDNMESDLEEAESENRRLKTELETLKERLGEGGNRED